MITNNGIQSLVNLFKKRQVSLYHACQLIDFESYLDLGGIPSRALLETKRLPFTAFETDTIDRENNVWDKVFVNLADFGYFFTRINVKSVPNPYGPILFAIDPSVLLQAFDIAICFRSAGAQGFDREREALNTLEEIDRLFVHPSNLSGSKSSYIKHRDQLVTEFGNPNARSPEVSCSVPNNLLPIQYVQFVRVDPYIVNGQPLRDWINRIKRKHGVQFPIYERDRFQDSSRKFLYNEIAERIGEKIPSLYTLVHDSTCSQPLQKWAKQISDGDLEWQFKRYATYLRDGTLKPMRTAPIPGEH
jgi:hypothetical protein